MVEAGLKEIGFLQWISKWSQLQLVQQLQKIKDRVQNNAGKSSQRAGIGTQKTPSSHSPRFQKTK